jgi:hypothetical protein
MGFGQSWKINAKGTLFEPFQTLGGHLEEQVPQLIRIQVSFEGSTEEIGI